jgi:hypothetical protein
MVGVSGFSRLTVEIASLFKNRIWLCRRMNVAFFCYGLAERLGFVVGDVICWDAWLVLLW